MTPLAGSLSSSARWAWMSGVCMDITDRKQAEDHMRAALRDKEVLRQEVHHRVKNNLQVISSLLSLQAGYIEDPRGQAMFADCWVVRPPTGGYHT